MVQNRGIVKLYVFQVTGTKSYMREAFEHVYKTLRNRDISVYVCDMLVYKAHIYTQCDLLILYVNFRDYLKRYALCYLFIYLSNGILA